jgi:hypothetical protein
MDRLTMQFAGASAVAAQNSTALFLFAAGDERFLPREAPGLWWL